jgi:uncharacterized iron-regulated membrane protein
VARSSRKNRLYTDNGRLHFSLFFFLIFRQHQEATLLQLMVDAMIALKDGHLGLLVLLIVVSLLLAVVMMIMGSSVLWVYRVYGTSAHRSVMGLSNHRVCRVSRTSVRSGVMGSSICRVLGYTGRTRVARVLERT